MRSQTRRPRGTGSLYEYRGAWYATFWVGGRQVKRKVGPKRKPRTREGLTQVQAEARLRRVIEEVRVAPPHERLTVGEAAERYVRHVELVMERKPRPSRIIGSCFAVTSSRSFGDARSTRLAQTT